MIHVYQGNKSNRIGSAETDEQALEVARAYSLRRWKGEPKVGFSANRQTIYVTAGPIVTTFGIQQGGVQA